MLPSPCPQAGKPTFRITRNEIGESHAIETALRLKLPRKLVERAESLLDEDGPRPPVIFRRRGERAAGFHRERATATPAAHTKVGPPPRPRKSLDARNEHII